MGNKRIIEVFIAGCSVCQPIIEIVQGMACSSCEVVVYDLSKPCETKECIQKAQQYGIKSLPSIAVNGVLLNCCQNSGISESELIKAGVGSAA